MHLYVVSSVPPRIGASLNPPECLSCPPPAPLLPPLYQGAATHSATVRDSYDWDDDSVTTEAPPTDEPKKRRKKGTVFHFKAFHM